MNLTIKKETGQFLYALCPFHKDSVASLCINKVEHNEKPAGFYYCFGCNRWGQLTEEELKKLSKKKARRKKSKSLNWYSLWADYLATYDTLEPLVSQWDVDIGVLRSYGVGWDGQAWTIPMKNAYEKIIGIQKRFPDGSKCCVEESQLGLFIPIQYQIFNQRPQLIITEGFSDCVIAAECGYFAVGKPCAGIGDEMVLEFVINHSIASIYITADNNLPGIEYSRILQKKLLTKGIKCDIIYIDNWKDLREYYQNEGREKTIKLLGG